MYSVNARDGSYITFTEQVKSSSDVHGSQFIFPPLTKLQTFINISLRSEGLGP